MSVKSKTNLGGGFSDSYLNGLTDQTPAHRVVQVKQDDSVATPSIISPPSEMIQVTENENDSRLNTLPP